MIIARLLFPSLGRSTAAKSTREKEPTPSSNQAGSVRVGTGPSWVGRTGSESGGVLRGASVEAPCPRFPRFPIPSEGHPDLVRSVNLRRLPLVSKPLDYRSVTRGAPMKSIDVRSQRQPSALLFR